ncbi:uncharacterized protein LOC144917638 [Branchiostoma floridae x Branchiostoma belcheri]
MSQSKESFEGASASEEPRGGNDDDDNRAILVSNIPHTLSDDKVVIHFQRRASGGGDVKQVRRLSPSQAKVIFENVKVVRSVVARKHDLDGVTLQVQAWSSFLARALEMDRARHRESNCVQRATVQIHQPVSQQIWNCYEQKMSKTDLDISLKRSTINGTIALKGSWNDVVEAKNFFFYLLCEDVALESTTSLDSKVTGSRNGQNQAEEGVTNSLEQLQPEDASSNTPAGDSQHQLQAAVNSGTENPGEDQLPERVDLDRKQREGASNTRPYDKKEEKRGASHHRSNAQMPEDSQKWNDDRARVTRGQSSETREENRLKEEMEYGRQANFQQSTTTPGGTSSAYGKSSMGAVEPLQEGKEKNCGASSSRSTAQVTTIDESRVDNMRAFVRSQISEPRQENLQKEGRNDGRSSSLQRSVSAPGSASSVHESSKTRTTRPNQDTPQLPSSLEPSRSRGGPTAKHGSGNKMSGTFVKTSSTLHSETASAAEEWRNGRLWSHSEGRKRPGGTYKLADISDNEEDVFGNSKNTSTVTVEQPVEPDILSYIIKVQQSKITAITDRHEVNLSHNEEKTVVYFKGLKKNAEDALEDFITLYQGLFSKIKSISLDTNMHDVKLETCSYAVECVQKSSPSVYIKNKDGNIIFIGDESEVRSARAQICSILKISESRRRKPHTSSVPTVGLVGKMTFRDSIKGVQICVVEGDITQQKVDVIVNAANSSLSMTLGVSGAISKAGGSSIQTECNSITGRRGYLNTTDCVWTWGGRLPCKFVIHAVGPHYSSYGAHRNQQDLHDTCHKVLRMAASELKAVSIAMPAISSGACGMPRDLCAESMFSAITDFIENTKDNSLVDICLIDNDRRAADIFSDVFRKMRKKFNTGKGHLTSPNLEPMYPPSGSSTSPGTSYPGAGSTSVTQGTGQTSSSFQVSISSGQTSPNLSNTSYSGWEQTHQNMSSGVASASSPQYPGPTLTYVKATSSSYPHGNATTPRYPHPTPNYSASSPSSASGNSDKEDTCPICLSDFTGAAVTTPCKHKFCADCLDSAMKVSGQCPVCKSVIGRLKGNQPQGSMTHHTDYLNPGLSGYESHSTIEIQYYFSGGIQGPEHPNPGKPYSGTSRRAYLPNNVEGREVLRLLQRAFDSRLVFTIGTSVTTGQTDTVVWNDIHHKTSKYGGPNSYGYPDPQYLTRVKEELAAKGIK